MICLQSGAGNDVLDGGQARPAWKARRWQNTNTCSIPDSGQDTEYSTNGDVADRADETIFGSGVTSNQVHLARVNGNLVLSIDGAADSITVEQFYRSEPAD